MFIPKTIRRYCALATISLSLAGFAYHGTASATPPPYSCLDKFRLSSAAESAWRERAEPRPNNECYLNAMCFTRSFDDLGRAFSNFCYITVPFDDADDVINCDGRLYNNDSC